MNNSIPSKIDSQKLTARPTDTTNNTTLGIHADKYLQAKDKQESLKHKRMGLVKLIHARKNRLAILQATINADIEKYTLSINGIDAALHHIESEKDNLCADMLELLQSDNGDEAGGAV